MEVVALSLASPAHLLDGYCRLDRQLWEDELPGLEPPVPSESLAELYDEAGARRCALAAVDSGGDVVGVAVWRQSLLEDVDLAYAWLIVDRPWRRNGIARALHAAMAEVAGSHGVKRVESGARVGSPGAALSAALGGTVAQVELCNVLQVDPAALPEQPPVPAGYELRTWSDRCPEELAEAFASAHSAMNDIPQEGLGHDDWDWTAARLRGHEDYRLRAGFHTVVSAAVHVASGEVAGYTELMAVGRPSTVLQEDTGVVRGHRGHGLGLLLKVANLRALLAHAPQTRTVVTWNAETNAHMLAVNNLLGFRPHSRWEQVTAPLPVP